MPRLLDLRDAAGLRCPGDVSVVGCNDHPLLARLATPPTCVRIPQRESGAEAARLLPLPHLMAGPGPPKQLLLPTRLIDRTSTAPAT